MTSAHHVTLRGFNGYSLQTIESLTQKEDRLTFLDTSAIIPIPAQRTPSLVTLVGDVQFHELINTFDLARNLDYLKTAFCSINHPNVRVTRTTLDELLKWQQRYTSGLRHYNGHQHNISCKRYEKTAARGRLILESLNEYGEMYNKILQRLKHKVYSSSRSDFIDTIAMSYRELIKQKALEPKITQRLFRKGMNETVDTYANDVDTIAHMFSVSVFEHKPVALVTADSDFKRLIPMGIQALCFHQCDTAASDELYQGFQQWPIIVYQMDYSHAPRYTLAFNSATHMPRHPLVFQEP